MQGGVLKTYFAPHSPKISIAPVEPNEYLEGIFESRNISNFMTLDNLANLSAIKKLLVSLQTQTSKIQQIITKLEKKKLFLFKFGYDFLDFWRLSLQAH